MLRGNKNTGEVRFELVIMGAMLLTAAGLYLVFQNTPLLPLVFFFPGLILLGGAIFQDLQPEWKAGWLTYLLAIGLAAYGLAGYFKVLGLEGGSALIIGAVILGVVFIIKALYDPNPKE